MHVSNHRNRNRNSSILSANSSDRRRPLNEWMLFLQLVRQRLGDRALQNTLGANWYGTLLQLAVPWYEVGRVPASTHDLVQGPPEYDDLPQVPLF